MGFRKPITILALGASLIFSPISAIAETDPSVTNKVLSQVQGGFNVAAVESLLQEGDRAVTKGDLKTARKSYDKARKASKLLLSFYRDLSGAFRGLDARIPREMDSKGRQTLTLFAKANLRLAALFRRQNKPEVAVPLLVEVVKLTTPSNREGQKAYQTLIELGFVDTPYGGAM